MPGRMVQNTYELLKEIENNRKSLVAVEVNNGDSTKY